ncbi:MAG: PTS IIA-like nitrogen regulatory protein PtsN [Alphaproteobacteria bacterium]|nr:PTS IIA-like nitrogen regulatory protein PtsN [Alphaproteobacteria bacterium]
MEIRDLLSQRGVIPRLRATSKKQLLQELAERAAELFGVHERTIFDALLERERLGSTGSGKGIAIPHARLVGLERLIGVFARLESPIEFESVDGRPVDLVFMLLAPASAGADHLKALSNVSRLLRREEVVERLRGSDRADAILALLIEPPARSAA